jgi:hypothetical protein
MLTQTIEHPMLGSHNVEFTKGRYGNERLAILLKDLDEGGTFCVLTVNIPEASLEEGEFLVKGWSENEPIANVLRNSTYFIDTKKRVPTGHVEAEVWRFRDYKYLKQMAPEPALRRT